MQKTNISKEVHGQANAPALRNLGISFHHGIGVARDSEGMCSLAEAYWYARGTRKNYQKAYQWFLVANPDVSRHWSVCPELYESLECHLTKKQISEAKIWAKNWKRIATAS
jgi:hypothetical protein